MTETLFNAYLPLILWTSVGLLLFRFIPQGFPRLLGRWLYWVGMPIEILALARKTDLSDSDGIAAAGVTFAALGVGLAVAMLSLWALRRFTSQRLKVGSKELVTSHWQNPTVQGSFIIASMLGNTGFVGLAIAPALISDTYLNWAVYYSITHNIIGVYVFGVIIASYFSHSTQKNHWWILLRDVLSVPTLWAFVIGYLTQPFPLPELVESGLQASINVVISCAFLLIGIRLCQVQGLKSFRFALIPAVLRVMIIPAIVGIGTTCLMGLSGDRRLAMVLMAGVPSAFVGLILAEEYDLDRDLVASSIVVSTVLLLLLLPAWVVVFGG